MVPADGMQPEGGCACGAVRYRMTAAPMFVHCCHCRWCQRETGSAFAVNALVEADRLVLLQGAPETVVTPSESGRGQKISRCPACRVAVWSNYAGAGDGIRFLRAGTLDRPEAVTPDMHIYTASRQPWFALPDGVRSSLEYYDMRAEWPAESLARYRLARRQAGGSETGRGD